MLRTMSGVTECSGSVTHSRMCNCRLELMEDDMKSVCKSVFFGLFALAFAGYAGAQDVFIYPQKGQSAEQQDKDKYECYNWAKENSGFDPMAAPTTSSPRPRTEEKSHGILKGAAVGAVGGAILGDSSKTTRRAAAAGGLLGGVRQHQHNSSEQQRVDNWEQRESASYANNRSNYNRAYAACLEGRGYTVK